ncbi:hypothetical protein L596_012402 [Steinernema carpocapsae]|uniref:BPTI/Kunitz inhibitor domain-containing protein n=1 Tax=Steinernema carpocapsae TaxID=34508 RepID=A0A4U5NXS6_STECR|nr:hypothetical protein L596_012402 [Steinernema carpocapsae]
MFFIIPAIVLIFLGSTFGHSCDDPQDSGLGNQSYEKFFYDPVWNACFAFKYKGSRGNENRFGSRAECEGTCMPMDGPVCNGPGKSYVDPTPKSYPSLPSGNCKDAICPNNYTCTQGFGVVLCCLTENFNASNQAYDHKCPNGAKAGGVTTEYFMATFAKTCDDLICDKGYKCQQVNKYFAKCCQSK